MPKDKKTKGAFPTPYARPSRDERQTRRQIQALQERADREGRTRRGSAALETIAELEAGTPGVVERVREQLRQSRPPKKLKGTGKAIYSGKARTFDSAFAKAWWKEKGFHCKCVLCKKDILAAGTGTDAPSIDHKEPWSRRRAKLETHLVCCNGVHWDVVFAQDFRSEFQDPKNLQPAHKGCNSSKSGPKDFDSIAPQKRGPCPNKMKCTVTKAVSS